MSFVKTMKKQFTKTQMARLIEENQCLICVFRDSCDGYDHNCVDGIKAYYNKKYEKEIVNEY